ncbi:putative p9a protein [Pueraria lobata-associated crinivirus]|nr:putative p9a protein [Pueraria lobata-associated crinivirus]
MLYVYPIYCSQSSSFYNKQICTFYRVLDYICLAIVLLALLTLIIYGICRCVFESKFRGSERDIEMAQIDVNRPYRYSQ